MIHRLKNSCQLTICMVFLVFFQSVCPSFAAELIRINGSGSALDMMKPLIKAYQKKHPEVRVEMGNPLGSSGAVKALLNGALDITVSSKPLKPADAALGARAHDFGKTPLLIVTEKRLKKTGISTRELEGIYSGSMHLWPDGTAVRVVLRPEGDVDTVLLRSLSPGMNSAIGAAQSKPGMLVAVTDPESNAMVAKTPGAIGATGLTSIMVENLSLNTLTLNGVKGTTQNLSSGAYPLAKDIRFITMTTISPAAVKLLKFVFSREGRSIAEKAGVFVPASSSFSN